MPSTGPATSCTADRGYLIEKGQVRHEAPTAELVGSTALQRYLGV